MSALPFVLALLGHLAWGAMPGGPRAVASVGDIDDDGIPDVLCGDRDGGDPARRMGAAWVFSGKDGTVLRRFEGTEPCDAFGQSVAAWTDLDGDGVVEVAIAAPGYASDSASGHPTSPPRWPKGCPSVSPGSVFVYSGRTGAQLLRLVGAEPGDRFGYELASDGDVDGDGRRDLIVGAPGSSSVSIYSGKDAARIWTVLDDTDTQEFGRAVGCAGDLDGDGCAEVLVGAPMGPRSCAVVLAGKDHRTLRRHTTREAGAPEANVHIGSSVAGVGDVDGDGVPDYAIGAEHDGKNIAGRVRLCSGATGAELALLAGTEPIVSSFGGSVCGVGDVDGDHVPDVLVSDPDDSVSDDMPRGQSPGSLQAFSGKTHARIWQLFGERSLECLGYSVSAVGDLDADGILDVAARGAFGERLCVLVSGKSGSVMRVIHRPERCDDKAVPRPASNQAK